MGRKGRVQGGQEKERERGRTRESESQRMRATLGALFRGLAQKFNRAKFAVIKVSLLLELCHSVLQRIQLRAQL